LHKEKLNNMYSFNSIRMITSSRMRENVKVYGRLTLNKYGTDARGVCSGM